MFGCSSRFRRAMVIGLVILFLATEAFAAMNFFGFRSGQRGIGGTAGWPLIQVRYQTWSHWRRAWFGNVGLDTAGFLNLSVDRAFYFYDVQDRWKETGWWSSAFFYGYLGALIGLPTNEGVQSRVGAEGGLGLEYVLPDPAWSVRAEVGSSLHIAGKEAAAVHAGVGLTYYFDFGDGRKSPNQEIEPKSESAPNDAGGDDLTLDESGGPSKASGQRKPAAKSKKRTKKKPASE